MKEIDNKLKLASSQYNAGESHLRASIDLIQCCLTKLANCSNYELYGSFNGSARIDYFAFSHNNEFSRPIRDDLFINEYRDFHELYICIIETLNQKSSLSRAEESDITN